MPALPRPELLQELLPVQALVFVLDGGQELHEVGDELGVVLGVPARPAVPRHAHVAKHCRMNETAETYQEGQ